MKQLRMSPLVLALIISWAVWVTVSLTVPFSDGVPKDKNQKDSETAPKHQPADDVSLMFRTGRFIDQHNGVFSALATIVIAYFTYSLRESTDKLWGAGERQLNATIKATETSNRPWVDLNVEIASGIEWHKGSPRISYTCRCKNYGVAPAINFNVTPKLYSPKRFSQAREEVSKFAEELKIRSFHHAVGIGNFLFPQETRCETSGTALNAGDITESRETYREIIRLEPFATHITLSLLVIATYRATNHPTVHYTGRAFKIVWMDGQSFFKIDEDVPSGIIALQHELWGDNAE
jgi:hypothetical protein